MPTAFLNDPVYDQAFVVHSGGPLPYLLMGTAVQWNQDYAVTVKHIPHLPGAVYQGRGDVQFFRHKASSAPLWRSYVPGEAVTAVGFNSLYVPVKGDGRTLPAMVRLSTNEGNVLYATHDAPITQGMSGGPVFSADGKVVGISVAFMDASDLSRGGPSAASPERVSIFLPYAEISREWNRYMAQLTPVAKPTRIAAIRPPQINVRATLPSPG